MREITDFLEDLPEGTIKLKIRLGSTRTRLKTIKVFEEIPTDVDIEDVLLSCGFGDPHEYAQLVGVDAGGKHTKSKSLIRHVKREGGEDPLRILTEEFRMLMQEARRMISVNNDSFAAVVENNSILTQQNFQLRGDIFEAESATMALDLELQAAEAAQQSDMKSQGLEALTKAVDVYQTSQEKKALSPERVKELLMSSPGIVTQLVSDDDLVNLFTAEIMKGGVDDAESE